MLKYWTSDEDAVLSRLYPKYDKDILLESLEDRSWIGIVQRAGKLGLKRKNRKASAIKFDKITTEIEAYLLGFITADGSIGYYNKKSNKYRLDILLASKDQEFLEMLKTLFCPDIRLQQREIRGRNYCRLQVNDDEMCRNLIALGVIPNKVRQITPPTFLVQELRSHYLRGLFDGDGCIHIDNLGRLHADINGHEPLLQFVNQCFLKVYRHKAKVRKANGCYQISYGSLTAEKFLDYLYGNGNVYLPRKHDRYIFYKNSKRLRREK